MKQKSKKKTNTKKPLDDPITIDEAKWLQDGEWTDAIYDEFKSFDVEILQLTGEEYKTLTIPQRFIRMLKRHIENENNQKIRTTSLE